MDDHGLVQVDPGTTNHGESKIRISFENYPVAEHLSAGKSKKYSFFSSNFSNSHILCNFFSWEDVKNTLTTENKNRCLQN